MMKYMYEGGKQRWISPPIGDCQGRTSYYPNLPQTCMTKEFNQRTGVVQASPEDPKILSYNGSLAGFKTVTDPLQDPKVAGYLQSSAPTESNCRREQ